VVAVVITLFILNQYAVSNLQFRLRGGGENIDFATLSANIIVDTCNPTSVPVSFEKYTLTTFYKGNEFATLTFYGKTIQPRDSELLNGRVDLNGELMAGLFLNALAEGFSGGQSGFDENAMTAKETFETKLLGIIPLSQSRDIDPALGDSVFGRQYSCD
jgi:hypothetical protein